MTQEERKQKRKKDTKNAIILLSGMLCIVAVLGIGGVLSMGHFFKNQVTNASSNTETKGNTEISQTQDSEAKVESSVVDELTQQAIAVVTNMTLEQKVAQMFMITPDALTGVTGATAAGNTTKQAFTTYPVGGLIYMKNNLKTKSQTQEMLTKMSEFSQEITGLPIFLGVDEEGGTVTRIASNTAFEVTNVGNMSEIGATGDPLNAYQAGTVIGTYLKELGFNVNFAPVADVLANEENTAIKERSFGSDSGTVSNMVLSVLQGFEENDIYGVIKHFPGHGSTAEDSHETLAINNKTLEELYQTDLVPFQNAIQTGVKFVMAGHIAVPNITGNNLPSSLSEYMITQVLRNEMGYKGVVITDAMNMKAITDTYSSAEAAITAINAGVDIILMPDDFKTAYQAVIDAVKKGTITEERINTSAVRIVKVKLGM